MSDPEVLDAVVVGAGLTGLVAAWQLARRGARVQVVEAAARPGGVIGSFRRDGFLVERGPNSAMESSPAIGALIDDLGLRPRLRYASAASARNRYLQHRGRPCAAPSGPGSFISTPLFSWRAKLGLLKEPFLGRPAGNGEATVADFVRRHLGPEFLEAAVEPLVAGIYAGDPDRLSVAAAFPALHALEAAHGSLVRGAIARARQPRDPAAPPRRRGAPPSFSFDDGLQVLTDALAAAVPTALDTRATHFEAHAAAAGGGFTLHAQGAGGTGGAQAWRCRRLLLATAAEPAAALLAGHHAPAAQALQAIGYAPVACVASAYRREQIAHALDGFGCLVPRREQGRVLGVLFSSSMFEGRAPAGHALLSTFVGGRRQPALAALPAAEVGRVAHEAQASMLGIRGEPLWQEVTAWPRAIPQYDLGHLERVAQACQAEQALPGLLLCANWRGGVSLGDCIEQGLAVAERAALH